MGGKSNSVPHKSVFGGGQDAFSPARSLAHVFSEGVLLRPDPTGGGVGAGSGGAARLEQKDGK